MPIHIISKKNKMVHVTVKSKLIKFIDFTKNRLKKMMKCFKIWVPVICIDLNFKQC